MVLGINPHKRKPVYGIWFYLTPDETLIAFDWHLIPNDSIGAVFNALRQRKLTHKSPTRLVVMDPNRGKAKQLGGRSWSEEFSEHDYLVPTW